MYRLIGQYYKFLYDLENHYLIEVKMRTWLNWALAIVALLTLLSPFPGRVMFAILFLLVIVALSLGNHHARRRYYVHFVPEQHPEPPEDPPEPLWPEDKLLHHASGHFEVEGQEGDWSHLIAYYRTFESREHAIMARLTPSSFLKFGEVRPDVLGMWYIFIKPENLLDVIPGRLFFGKEEEPGLKLRYRRFDKKGNPEETIAFLHFASEKDRIRVQDDLLLDMGGPARRPWRPLEAAAFES